MRKPQPPEQRLDLAPALLPMLARSCRRRPELHRSRWTPAKAVILAVWPFVGVAAANRGVTLLLLPPDRRGHLVPLPSRRVKMHGAELLRRTPHGPPPTQSPILTPPQASALSLAPFIRRSRLREKKTEVKIEAAHCQRPCLIWPTLSRFGFAAGLQPRHRHFRHKKR